MPKIRIILCLLWLTVVSLAAWAQEKPDVAHDLSGTWRSSTGVSIHIPPYEQWEAPGGFAFHVTFLDGRSSQYQAKWRDGFRQGFTYFTPGQEEIFAVVDRDGKQISLGNKDHTWKAVWTRTQP